VAFQANKTCLLFADLVCESLTATQPSQLCVGGEISIDSNALNQTFRVIYQHSRERLLCAFILNWPQVSEGWHLRSARFKPPSPLSDGAFCFAVDHPPASGAPFARERRFGPGQLDLGAGGRGTGRSRRLPVRRTGRVARGDGFRAAQHVGCRRA